MEVGKKAVANESRANVGQVQPVAIDGIDAEVYGKAMELIAACRETPFRAIVILLDGSNEATILGGISAGGAADVLEALAEAARDGNVVTERTLNVRPGVAN